MSDPPSCVPRPRHETPAWHAARADANVGWTRRVPRGTATTPMELARIPWTAPAAPDAAELRRVLEDEGFSVWSWTDRPGARYGAHSHDHDESIWVVAGDITFGLAGTDHPLRAGDRLMLPRDTVHTAVVGVDGATYLIGER